MKHKKHSSVVLDYLFVPPATIVLYLKPGTLDILRREKALVEHMTNSKVYYVDDIRSSP